LRLSLFFNSSALAAIRTIPIGENKKVGFAEHDFHDLSRCRENTVTAMIRTRRTEFLSALPRQFYDRDPRPVSRELLGKLLVRRRGRQILTARIVEVEAYLGSDDSAAHAAAGRTARNDVLFGPPGHAYVYFIYGNHYCLNVSCLPDGIAGGILFRGAEPLKGIEQMARARGLTIKTARDLRLLTVGPGRMAEAFGITRARDNGKDLTSPDSDLFIADDGFRASHVAVTPRIGITKAAALPLRYVIAGNSFVSGPARLRSGARLD
jgi:DNA-3-methyladenine glycosylase